MPSLDKGSADPNQLNEGGGTDGSLKQREFLWDSIVLYLVSVILALTAFDALSEYIRGTGVTCIDKNGDESGNYINVFCGGNLPVTEYVPAFLFIHGLAIAIPHFLWLATYGGQFDYFFSIVKHLDREKDKTTGKYTQNNIDIVRQIEHSFTTYKRNSIYWLYTFKLSLQLVFALASFVLSAIYFTDFDVVFPCPRHINDTNTSSFPSPDQVTCVFSSLKLLFWIRIVDLCLIGLILCCIFWGFWFCASGHPTELRPKKASQFSFESGMNPDMYLSRCWYCPSFLSCCCVRCAMPLFTSPRITTDLDFLLLALFRTNAGIGKLFKDVQIELQIQDLIQQDTIAVKLFKHKWNSGKHVDVPDGRLDWEFKDDPTDVYDSEDQLKHTCISVKLPSSIRGAALGLSTYTNGLGGMSITFNPAGYGLALSRMFARIATIEFTSFIKEVAPTQTDKSKGSSEANAIDQLVDIKHGTASQLHITMPEDILVSEEKITKKLLQTLDPIWQVDKRERIKTSFIIIGPMTKSQSTIVNLFLHQLCSNEFYLDDGCIIVTLQPKRVSGKGTGQEFSGFNKRPHNCTPLSLNLDIVNHKLIWPPEIKRIPETTPTKESSDSAQPLEEVSAADVFQMVQKTDVKMATVSVVEHESLPELVPLLCGDIITEFEVCAYRFKLPKHGRHGNIGVAKSATPKTLPKVENKDKVNEEGGVSTVVTHEC